MKVISSKYIAWVLLCFFSASSWSQQLYSLNQRDVKHRADGALAMMSFAVVPDLTSSFLSISSGGQKNGVLMTQFAGGATMSQKLPIYLEGGFAYERYDPDFVASDGTSTRNVPTRWNAVALTGGIGWDFQIMPDLVFRPILNFSLGEVASDLSAGLGYLSWKTGHELDFLNGGHMSNYGYGGSLMLAYERIRPENEINLEWRFTDILLKTFGSTAEGVKGTAKAEATSLYARYRAPTGMTALDRPLRYVLEAAHTTYLGDQRGILGFDYLSSLGIGLELDSSAHDVMVTRTRLVYRYAFGNNVRGVALGLAMSF